MNYGTINYPTQLHLVGHLYKHCIMMHGTMNVKHTVQKLDCCQQVYTRCIYLFMVYLTTLSAVQTIPEGAKDKRR